MAPAVRETQDQSSLGEAVLGRLLDQSHRLHPDGLVPMLVRELAPLGMTDVVVYVVDFEQHLLVAVPGAGPPTEVPLDIDATTAGRRSGRSNRSKSRRPARATGRAYACGSPSWTGRSDWGSSPQLSPPPTTFSGAVPATWPPSSPACW